MQPAKLNGRFDYTKNSSRLLFLCFLSSDYHEKNCANEINNKFINKIYFFVAKVTCFTL